MSRFCVVEGTKITLNDKESIPIERIKVGQEILTFDLNTLQKSQKYDILVKMKTNKFGGIFQEDLVKNVWKNNVDEYYLINDKLKITKDHIVMAKRDQTYYWTKVEKLLLNDYLFTELNIFERIDSIIIVKEKVKVFNLEVNRVFNYFANSYLIHNGAPCSACAACGAINITITQTTPGGYKYQVLSGYTTATVTVEGAMGSLSDATNPESNPTGCGAKIVGSFTVSAGSYIYYFVGEGDGSNFSGISGSGAGVTAENYNGGGFGANRRASNTHHGFKGGGSSFIAYDSSSSLVTINSDTTSAQLEDFSTSVLKQTILVVAGGGGGQATVDETGEETGSASNTGGNGGNAEGNSDNSGGSKDIVDWGAPKAATGVTGTFIMGVKGEDSLDADSRAREGGQPGNKEGPDGGEGGSTIAAWGGAHHVPQKGDYGKGGFDTGPGGDSNESAGYGWTSDPSTDKGRIPGGASIIRGGGGGGGIFGGGSGSLAGGGGGGGLSYYKKTHSGETVFGYTKGSSGQRTIIQSSPDSPDFFNGNVVIVLS